MGTDNNQNILVTVIIINYNFFELLEKCLASLTMHTKVNNYEIIVVDNNSTEGDVSKITKKYKKLRLVKNKSNMGFAAANNQALKIAKGEYILLLNNDTEFFEDTISKTLEFFKRTNERIIIGCKLLNEDNSLQASMYFLPTVLNVFSSNFFLYKVFSNSRHFNKYYLTNIQVNEPTEVDVVIGAFMFCRKFDLLELNGFDERFYFFAEEMDLCKRFKDLGGKVIYFPNTSIFHKGGGSTGNNSWFKYKHQAMAYIRYYQKHFEGLEFILVLIFHYSGLLLRIPLFFLRGIILFDKSFIKKSFYYLRQIFIYPENVFREQKG